MIETDIFFAIEMFRQGIFIALALGCGAMLYGIVDGAGGKAATLTVTAAGCLFSALYMISQNPFQGQYATASTFLILTIAFTVFAVKAAKNKKGS